MDVLTYFLAVDIFLAPIDWATKTCAPILGILQKHIPKFIKKAPAATADTYSSPKYLPINHVSIKLYPIDMSDVNTTGSANQNRLPAIGPSKMFIFFFIFYFPSFNVRDQNSTSTNFPNFLPTSLKQPTFSKPRLSCNLWLAKLGYDNTPIKTCTLISAHNSISFL